MSSIKDQIKQFVDHSGFPFQKIMNLSKEDQNLFKEYSLKYNLNQGDKEELKNKLDSILKKVDLDVDDIIQNYNEKKSEVSKYVENNILNIILLLLLLFFIYFFFINNKKLNVKSLNVFVV